MRMSENMRAYLKRIARNGPELAAVTDLTFCALKRRGFAVGEEVPGKDHIRRWGATEQGRQAVSRSSTSA